MICKARSRALDTPASGTTASSIANLTANPIRDTLTLTVSVTKTRTITISMTVTITVRALSTRGLFRIGYGKSCGTGTVCVVIDSGRVQDGQAHVGREP